jgi:hypothetical protein
MNKPNQLRNRPWQYRLSTALAAVFVAAILFACLHWQLRQPWFHVRVPVGGTVKLADGTLISSGEIVFFSRFQPRIIHSGVIENGRFELHSPEGGAVPGEYNVYIRDATPTISRRYSTYGALSARVSPFGTSEFKFLLKPQSASRRGHSTPKNRNSIVQAERFR